MNVSPSLSIIDIFHAAHRRGARFDASKPTNDPGIRYVLLHTFAHALMRQFTLEMWLQCRQYPRAHLRPATRKRRRSMAASCSTPPHQIAKARSRTGQPGQDLGFHIEGALEDMKTAPLIPSVPST